MVVYSEEIHLKGEPHMMDLACGGKRNENESSFSSLSVFFPLLLCLNASSTSTPDFSLLAPNNLCHGGYEVTSLQACLGDMCRC